MDNSVMDNVSEAVQTAVESPLITEKTIPQSQVNEIVGNAKREAADRAVEAYKRQQAQSAGQAQSSPQYQDSHRNMSEDDIKRVTDDRIKSHFTELQHEAQERSNVEAANRIVRMFGEKIVAGKDKYDDFETVARSVKMENYPGVVQLLAEHIDNSADVLYHLAKNRSKLYEFERFYAEQPEDAVYEIKRLSDSMKANDAAATAKNPNAPLSQNRPSNTGTDSGSSLSMSDLKRKYRA
jgi:UTP:GlnB (protein PII) uridylyltransferase